MEAALDAVGAAQASGRFRVRVLAGGGAPMVEVSDAPPQGAPVSLRPATEALDADGPLGPVIRHKTTHRAHYNGLRAAAPEADDVICHNSRGELTECTFGNLALRIGGEWLTPPASSGLLPGTFRAELLAQGRLREHPLVVADLALAEEVAFLNALRGWCPARIV